MSDSWNESDVVCRCCTRCCGGGSCWVAFEQRGDTRASSFCKRLSRFYPSPRCSSQGDHCAEMSDVVTQWQCFCIQYQNFEFARLPLVPGAMVFNRVQCVSKEVWSMTCSRKLVATSFLWTRTMQIRVTEILSPRKKTSHMKKPVTLIKSETWVSYDTRVCFEKVPSSIRVPRTRAGHWWAEESYSTH